MTEQTQQIQTQLWNIANTLRGKMDADDLSILKIISEDFEKVEIPVSIRPYGIKVGESAFALGYPKIFVQGTEVKLTNLSIVQGRYMLLGSLSSLFRLIERLIKSIH